MPVRQIITIITTQQAATEPRNIKVVLRLNIKSKPQPHRVHRRCYVRHNSQMVRCRWLSLYSRGSRKFASMPVGPGCVKGVLALNSGGNVHIEPGRTVQDTNDNVGQLLL